MKIAVVQQPPVYMDKAASIDRAVALMEEAAAGGCGDTWLATMQHVAREVGCWVVGCATSLEGGDVPATLPYRDELFADPEEWVNPGDAVVYKPFGGLHAGPMRKEKGLLIADIDVEAAAASRRKFDVSGNYARPDVFTLHVNRAKQSPISFA